MELYKDKNIEKSIRLRQEGKDCLSWIENFGLHLFDEKCMPRVSFNDGEKNEILVLRINKVQNIIYAYYCFFQTDSKGFSRFCVNKAESVDAAGLKDLMDRAKWEEDSTKNYWKEIFCGGKAHNVDETTLKRQETKTSPYYEMNMMEYIECIQKEIQKLLEKLCIPANENISKVLITEQYALAFPLKYALGRIFPNAKRTVYGCIQKIEEKSWKQNAAHFHISGKLLHSGLNTTPQMTISNVLSLREKGVTFTLPLSKGENGEYCLPTTSVIDNSELKWNDLIKGEIEPDYTVGNLAFKRVQLSMFADGFQNVFVNSGESLVCLSSNNNGIVVRTMPVPANVPKVVTTGTDSANTTENYGNETNKQKNTEQNPTIQESIDYDDKADKIFSNVTIGIKRTTKGLEFIARNFLLNKYKEELPEEIVESEKEAFWKKKYEECMKMDWQKTMLSNWKKYKQIEFSNFASFLRVYQYKGLSSSMRSLMFSKIDSAVSSLKDMRNLHAHASIDDIISLGRTKVLFSMEHMLIIAEQLHDEKLKERLQKYKIEIEEEWDNNFTDYLNNKH